MYASTKARSQEGMPGVCRGYFGTSPYRDPPSFSPTLHLLNHPPSDGRRFFRRVRRRRPVGEDGLLALQKTFVRIITGSHRLSHADPLFSSLGILKIADLYSHSLRVFSFKLHKKMLPSGVSSMFEEISHAHNTRGASSSPFVIHSDSSSIKAIAPRVWIQLDQLDGKLKPDQKLKTSPSIASFRERSKRGLLGSYEVCRVRACLSCAVSAPAASLA